MPQPILSRGDVNALIPQDVALEVINGARQQSACLQLMRRLPNMSTSQSRIPVLSALPSAYFVTGEAGDGTPGIRGQKQSSRAAWANKYINAEELAVIVPIPEAALDDASYDIWGQIKPLIMEAFGVALDGAILYGTNAPSTWPAAILAAAIAAGHVVPLGTGEDIYDDIMSVGGVFSKVETDGYMVTGSVAGMSMKAEFRGLRSSEGVPLFVRSMQQGGTYELDGAPCIFPANGSMDESVAHLFAGDWNQLVYAMRQDITYKILDQAVIQNTDGTIQYNLAQQDMVAMRAVMRIGWQCPNPINRMQETEASRFPIAVLTPKAG